MLTTIDYNTRVIDLTIGELLDIIKRMQSDENAPKEQAAPTVVYGISGIAQLFGCSRSWACKLKASGIIDDAISQTGRVIITDAQKALELWAKHSDNNQ